MKSNVPSLQSTVGWNKVWPPTSALWCSPTHGWNTGRLFLASLYSETPLNPPGGRMRRRVLHCLLPALFAVLSAVPAAASPIIETVGSFYFVPCDEFFDPDCSGYFALDNGVNVA